MDAAVLGDGLPEVTQNQGRNFPEWILVKESTWKSWTFWWILRWIFSCSFSKENGPKKSTEKSTKKPTAETKHQNPRVISGKGCPWHKGPSSAQAASLCGAGIERARKCLQGEHFMRCRHSTRSLQAGKQSTKINFWGPETAGWVGRLPREGVVVEKFAPSLESLSSLGSEERNLGCPKNFAGISQTRGVQKVCAIKVRAHFAFPAQSFFSLSFFWFPSEELPWLLWCSLSLFQGFCGFGKDKISLAILRVFLDKI